MQHEPAWHPDPTGRHQLRYWDGTAWTPWVSNDGQTTEDPIDAVGAPSATGAGPLVGEAGDLEAVSAHTRLVVEMVGGRATAGWRAVTDDTGVDVARLWCEGVTSHLCDSRGAPALTVEASTMGRGTDRKVNGLTVSSADGERASVGFTQVRTTKLQCKHEGTVLLTVQFRQTMTGKITDGILVDAAGRDVGTISEIDREGSGSTWRARLVLARDPSLEGMTRTLAVAAPVLVDTYLHAAHRR